MADKVWNADALRQPIHRPWCSDDKPMTPERILRIAQTSGEFTMHRYLYRAEKLRRRVHEMVQGGLLRRAALRGDFAVVKITEAGRAALAALPPPRAKADTVLTEER